MQVSLWVSGSGGGLRSRRSWDRVRGSFCATSVRMPWTSALQRFAEQAAAMQTSRKSRDVCTPNLCWTDTRNSDGGRAAEWSADGGRVQRFGLPPCALQRAAFQAGGVGATVLQTQGRQTCGVTSSGDRTCVPRGWSRGGRPAMCTVTDVRCTDGCGNADVGSPPVWRCGPAQCRELGFARAYCGRAGSVRSDCSRAKW